ncbi:MAG: hypothetical protein EA384_10310 [Spirochaetaceae bacterium]|nr:MAG: hypothetical protein EA384_10310 [Spirochaetaceae bacterium]
MTGNEQRSNQTWTARVWTPPVASEAWPATIGWCSHGFVLGNRWVRPEESQSLPWQLPLQGRVLSGTLEQVLGLLRGTRNGSGFAIAIFSSNRPEVERFLLRLSAAMPELRLAGGVAAAASDASGSAVVPAKADVNLLLLRGNNYRVTTHNLYDEADMLVEIDCEDPRTLRAIRQPGDAGWTPATELYRKLQRRDGLEAGDFETLTFSDQRDRNIHLHIRQSKLVSGCNLPAPGATLRLRRLASDRAAERLSQVAAEPNSIVFGCAGLARLLRSAPQAGPGSLIAFMHGEVVTAANECQLGNLMVNRLSVL